MARAFSLGPEMLFMDEPFSQVDALTAESLRAQVLDVWTPKDRDPKSIVMVSHDIREVVYMADRIVVLDANPGRVRTIVENRLPRPRDYRSPGLLQLVDRLHDIITGIQMPDLAAVEGTPRSFEPLPRAGGARIEGLLEYLDARGGREDVFRIAADTDREYGQVITTTNAAELLGLVETPHRTVVLSSEGDRYVKAGHAARKAIFREKVLELLLFQRVREAIRQAEAHEVDRDYVLEIIALNLPSESFEGTFETLVNWARFGDLFSYDEATEVLALSEGAPAAA
jgi:NitT/TauT family transport system ATP-binding protein